jgi:hypothetical protein
MLLNLDWASCTQSTSVHFVFFELRKYAVTIEFLYIIEDELYYQLPVLTNGQFAPMVLTPTSL